MIGSTAFAGAAARLAPSVVRIEAGAGTGAGLVWGDDGTIVTAAHVAVRDRVQIRFGDGWQTTGAVISRDRARDLALILPTGSLGTRPRATLGDPSLLRPGSLVFALGYPLGSPKALSTGVLQAVGRLPPGFEVLGPAAALDWVQADLRLAPGNSGGPIADASGAVIGLATMVANGLALAVPAPAIARLVARVWVSPARQARAAGVAR
jgi:serine protease Do